MALLRGQRGKLLHRAHAASDGSELRCGNGRISAVSADEAAGNSPSIVGARRSIRLVRRSKTARLSTWTVRLLASTLVLLRRGYKNGRQTWAADNRVWMSSVSSSTQSTTTLNGSRSLPTIACIFSIVSVRKALTAGFHPLPAGRPAPARRPPCPFAMARLFGLVSHR